MAAPAQLNDAPVGAWAVRLAAADAAAAAGLRREPGIEVCQVDDQVWLRGAACPPSLARRLAMLPGAERFAVGAQGAAVPWGARLPATTVPAGEWQSLAQAVQIALPAPALPGAAPERLVLRLVETDTMAADAALRCAWTDWVGWVETAPRHRLERLRFARCEAMALVLGDPLPPLPGERLWRCGPCLLPAGTALAPVDDPVLVARIIGLAADELALFDPDGRWDPLPPEALAAAARAAVRASDGAGDG